MAIYPHIRYKTKEERNRCRKSNYAGGRINTVCVGQYWDVAEEVLVEAHKVPDRELGMAIGRSVQAIQGKRNALKEIDDNYNENFDPRQG